MNKTDKIREGQIQIDDEHNYKPLVEPMLKETPRGGHLGIFRVGMCRPGLQIGTPF